MNQYARPMLAASCIVGVALIVAAWPPERPVRIDRDEILAQRQAYRMSIGNNMQVDVPFAGCAAGRIAPESAERVLMMVINQRADTLTDSERRQAMSEAAAAYQVCGSSNAALLASALHNDETGMMRGIAIELAQRGILDPIGSR